MPLSFAEQRMLVLEQLAPGPVMHVQLSLRLDGPLDREVLRRSLDHVVERHPSLRTVFPLADGRPSAVVLPNRSLPVEEADLTGSDQRLVGLAAELQGRRFDVSEGPLVRAMLVRLGADRHHLLVVTHHIISDRWSATFLGRDLLASYDAFLGGAEPELPVLTMDYRDHAARQSELLPPQRIDELAAHWCHRLSGAPATLDLSTDRRLDWDQPPGGGSVAEVLPLEQMQRLAALAERSATTRFVAVLAAFAAVLLRRSGQEDIVVGTHLAGRDDPETEGVVGCFMNTVPLRLPMHGDPSFTELLGRAGAVVQDALQHQQLPFDVLVARLAPDRAPQRNPVFQVDYSYWSTPAISGRVGDIHALEQPLDVGAVAVDLGLAVSVDGSGHLRCRLDHDLALFETASAQALLRQVSAAIAGGVEDPERPLSRLPLMDAEERQRVLRASCGGRRELPAATVVELIEAQAASDPMASAVVSSERRITRGELAGRANGLALRLARLVDAGPGTRVGLCLADPGHWVVAELAVLKVGAAFVPIEFRQPPNRIGRILADAGVAAVVTDQGAASSLGEPSCAVIRLEDDHLLEQTSEERPLTSGPDDLAYIVYTSGSTGTPKGVMVTHRNLTSSTWAHLDRYPGPMGHHVLLQSFAFDASIGTIIWTLCAGGTLVLPGTDTLPDTRSVVDLVERHRASHLACLPTLWQLVLARSDGRLDSLTTVIVGAEPCPPTLPANHARRVPWAELHNEYGPTETTVFSAAHRCRPDEPAPVPVGRPILNACTYVLDARGEPVPVGAPGELHIGGPGVTAGYLGRADLTAARFGTDPFSDEVGARLYRTGDRARWRPDGTLQLLGRLDDQVKVRGHRVELGEVEAALVSHRHVREAAAGVRPAPGGLDQLVAWVAASPFEEEDLRRHARRTLPRAMVPSMFVPVPSLPRAAGGKIDRRSLPEPTSWRETVGDRRLPSTSLERRVASMWEEALGVSSIGMDEDFFDLGGHSMLALELAVRVEESLGRDLPLATLLLTPTVRGMARALSELGTDRWSTLVPVNGASEGRALFCIHGAGGNVLRFRALADHLGPDVPLVAIQAAGLEGQRFRQRSIEEVASAYLAEVLATQPRPPYRFAGFSVGGVIAFEMAVQLRREGRDVDLLMLIDSASPRATVASSHDARAETGGARPAHRAATRLRTAARLVACEARLAIGRALPHRDRSFYLQRRFRRLWRRYRPQPYGGPALVLCSEGASETARSGWGPLVEGRLEIVEVPGTHEGLLLEPGASRVAQVLSARLAAGRGTDR